MVDDLFVQLMVGFVVVDKILESLASKTNKDTVTNQYSSKWQLQQGKACHTQSQIIHMVRKIANLLNGSL